MFPGPTGTNSVEAALKLARKVTGRPHVLSFTNAFHGMTLGSLAVTGNSMKRQGAGVPLTNTSSMPYDGFFDGQTPDFLWLRHALEDSGSGVDKPAAVIVETVQGEGGLRAARASWLRGLAELCRQHGILLIVDDVQAGCGRTGTFFSFEDAGHHSRHRLPVEVHFRLRTATVFDAVQARAGHLEAGRAQRDLPRPQPGIRHGSGGPGALLAGPEARVEGRRDLRRSCTRGWPGSQREPKAPASVAGDCSRESTTPTIKWQGRSRPNRSPAACWWKPPGPKGEVIKTMPALTINPEELQKGLDILAEAAESVTGRKSRGEVYCVGNGADGSNQLQARIRS